MSRDLDARGVGGGGGGCSARCDGGCYRGMGAKEERREELSARPVLDGERSARVRQESHRGREASRGVGAQPPHRGAPGGRPPGKTQRAQANPKGVSKGGRLVGRVGLEPTTQGL